MLKQPRLVYLLIFANPSLLVGISSGFAHKVREHRDLATRGGTEAAVTCGLIRGKLPPRPAPNLLILTGAPTCRFFRKR